LRTKLSILIFVGFLDCSTIFGQDFEETIRFADLQFKQKKYFLAIKEYKRALFFCDGKLIDELYRKVAETHYQLHEYSQASVYYDYAYSVQANDSIRNELIIQKATCMILEKKFQFALAELFNINDLNSRYFIKKKNFYLGICYFGLENFRLAGNAFVEVIDSSNIAAREGLRQIFSKKKNFYRPNPDLASYMSMVIPGSGQIYCGDIKNGINSLLLTSALFALGIDITKEYKFLDAFMAVFPWFYRYYQGGFAKAEKIAIAKRAEKRNKTFQQILTVIEMDK
jgi:tetratricopeptide (TPR) repeat protein